MLCVCPLCEINFTSKIVIQNSEYYSTSDAIFSSLRWGRKANEGCFKNGMAFPATFAFWQKLSDLPFRSYKALNIPQNGLHTFFRSQFNILNQFPLRGNWLKTSWSLSWGVKTLQLQLKSEILNLNLKSEIRKVSEIWNLKFKIQNLKSKIWNPKSDIQNLKSRIWNKKS